MNLVAFRSIIDEVLSLHGDVEVVFIGDEPTHGMVSVQELDAAAVTINGKIVFAFIASTVEGNTKMLQ